MKSNSSQPNGAAIRCSALLAAALGTFGKSAEQSVQVVANPQHTRNLFGPVGEIAGKRLKRLERNPEGDCLCIFEGRMGKNIVDVDRRDIQADNNG